MDISFIKQKKAMTIGIVAELTGLTERQIRYYETRKLIQPERSNGGTRKYSFQDVEQLILIHKRLQEGESTYEMRQNQRKIEDRKVKETMLKGQYNAAFKKY